MGAPAVRVRRGRVLVSVGGSRLLLVHRQVDDVLADGVQVHAHVGVRLVVDGRRGPWRRRRRQLAVAASVPGPVGVGGHDGVVAVLFRRHRFTGACQYVSMCASSGTRMKALSSVASSLAATESTRVTHRCCW